MLHIDMLTIFPQMFPGVVGCSMLKRAQDAALASIAVHDLRDYTTDKRRTVDDRPFGGGPGMVMKPEPIFAAVEAIEARRHPGAAPRAPGCRIVLMAPQGQRLTHPVASKLSGASHLLIICGHYEGVDERIRQALVDEEISIGDYVLTGGELPALVLADAVVRLIPGVVGHAGATADDSFAHGWLEYPQYTRPVDFRGMAAPQELRGGDHQQVETWRKLHAFARTATHRPDLLKLNRRTDS